MEENSFSIGKSSTDSLAGTFRFKHFIIRQGTSAQKVTTDSVLLGSLVKLEIEPEFILDVGAGNGILSLMSAQRWSRAKIDAVEIDKSTCEECEINFKESPWKNRLNLINTDFIDWETDKKFDLIISNPPYFKEKTFSPLPRRSLARSEGSLNYNRLIDRAFHLLTDNGTLAFISPASNVEEIEFFAMLKEFKSMRKIEIITVEGKLPSLIIYQLGKDGNIEIERLVIRDKKGSYTKDYVEKTKDFYLFLH